MNKLGKKLDCSSPMREDYSSSNPLNVYLHSSLTWVLLESLNRSMRWSLYRTVNRYTQTIQAGQKL
jgi:hypothetical protein